ncbi:MAG: BlaI/MecI/CopY family transcriptional regulator [Clostridia bacterium]|nr:BlaI/MecI/CopY family transcriptional regulator [Clostridia bacterium]
MGETKKTHLPDAELDVMMALWQRGEPSSVSDIHRDLQAKRTCSKPAVHILLDRLAAKGFVQVEVVDTPVTYKRITALVTEEEYCLSASESFVEKICRGRWQRLIATLVQAGEITDDDLEEIAQIVNRKGE